jgi:hypothetical protein
MVSIGSEATDPSEPGLRDKGSRNSRAKVEEIPLAEVILYPEPEVGLDDEIDLPQFAYDTELPAPAPTGSAYENSSGGVAVIQEAGPFPVEITSPPLVVLAIAGLLLVFVVAVQ